MKKIKIGIDGPAGSGKSVVGKIVAERLHYQFIDTGLIYRAFTYHCLTNNYQFSKKQDIHLALATFECQFKENYVVVNGNAVSNQLFSLEVVNNIRQISNYDFVRDYLTRILQHQVTDNGIVMIGRDITTVVLPEAELKIYLTASLAVRAQRRHIQLDNGQSLKLTQQDLQHRDQNDEQRTVAPLKIANDALIIDNSELTIEQTVSSILTLAKKVGK